MHYFRLIPATLNGVAAKALAGLAVLAASTTNAAPTGYTGIYGGGPLYKQSAANLNEIKNAGFNEVIVWSVQIGSNGDLNLNGEFPLTSGGAYIGNSTWPQFGANLMAMKRAGVKRVTLSVGSSNANPSDFDRIRALINTDGTGPNSRLYRSFQAIRQALPAVDAIDFDDESTYDNSTMVQFGAMLGAMGFKVTLSPYVYADFWTQAAAQINWQKAGTVDGVHLQAYSGGAWNNPCSGWNFGAIPVFPGIADYEKSPIDAQNQMRSWGSQCGLNGGFLWLYDDVAGKTYNGTSTANAYAQAIKSGLNVAYPAPGAYNIQTTSADGYATANGGVDESGYAYSSNQLGSLVTWKGLNFKMGSGALSGWSATSITPPAGQYNNLSFLAAGMNGHQPDQTFIVHYTDGSSETIRQSLSDWYSPQAFAGESNVFALPYRNKADGGRDSRTFYIYGYTFPINSRKTVSSIALPSNRNVVVLAYNLDTRAAATYQVNLSYLFNTIGMTSDGTRYGACGPTACTGGGLDASGYAYSSNLLGTSVSSSGITYYLGNANTLNAITALGQTIPLTAGKLSSLRVLGTAVNGSQVAQSFKVRYTDGSSTSFSQSMSDWAYPQSYAGEVAALPMNYRTTGNGGTDQRAINLYSYNFVLDPTKTPQSIELPYNANVKIMAISAQY